MKRIFVLLLALLLLFSACTDQTPPPEEKTLEDIERRATTGYETAFYGYEYDTYLLRIERPAEWQLEKRAGGFDIVCDGETVGTLLGKDADNTDDFRVLQTASHTVNDIKITKSIEQKKGDSQFLYRYVYTYRCDGESRTVTLTADYAQVDEKTEKKLYSDVMRFDRVCSETVGMLAGYLDEPPAILLLGNSFIGTSRVGDMLREMLTREGKEATVEAISRGYASVLTYASDKALLQRIRQGSYDAVFLCGFYSEGEIANLGIVKEACDEGKTELIIFPAHNENAAVVALAEEEYPSLFCLNWKGELDGLIAGGVDRWDLCIDDAHDHSRPLAGYVGAHMIYRAIYGELPSVPVQNILTQDYIDEILGEYAYVGDTYLMEDERVTYLN